ncbi:MAG: leucine-rich repeat domain-containing protein [Lachnospiraceae bacterium]|nr:leucine-rich repeat domain-containing protein [Lachnospiraceae bacterium]
MRYGSLWVFFVFIICLFCWETNQEAGENSSLVCPIKSGKSFAMAAATDENTQAVTGGAIPAYTVALNNNVKVGDIVCVDYVYYKVTASSAKKRTVCVVGFDEEATQISFVSKIKLQGKSYTVTKVDSYAFFGCEVLHGKVELLNSVGTVGSYAFYGCFNITEINVGKRVKTIGKKAFYRCKHVTKVQLQKANSLKSIGSKAFCEISSKAKIYYKKKNVKKLIIGKYNLGKLLKA